MRAIKLLFPVRRRGWMEAAPGLQCGFVGPAEGTEGVIPGRSFAGQYRKIVDGEHKRHTSEGDITHGHHDLGDGRKVAGAVGRHVCDGGWNEAVNMPPRQARADIFSSARGVSRTRRNAERDCGHEDERGFDQEEQAHAVECECRVKLLAPDQVGESNSEKGEANSG
jgi:hypothetical protein